MSARPLPSKQIFAEELSPPITTPKPNIIPLTSSILEELPFSQSALLSQRVSVPKTNTVPLSFSDLEKPPSSLSAPISILSSHTPPNDPLDAPALIDSEWQYICNFNSFLAQLKLEECATCNERWFDMKLSNEVCKACRGSNIQKKLYSKSNNADVGSIPHNLPSLSEIEEILIARAHVHVQVRQIKGQQFSYSRYTVNFMRNVTKVYRKLPLLPSHLDIILSKSASRSYNDNRVINQQLEQYFVFSGEK